MVKPIKHIHVWQWKPELGKWRCRLCDLVMHKVSGEGGKIDITHRDTLDFLYQALREYEANRNL